MYMRVLMLCMCIGVVSAHAGVHGIETGLRVYVRRCTR